MPTEFGGLAALFSDFACSGFGSVARVAAVLFVLLGLGGCAVLLSEQPTEDHAAALISMQARTAIHGVISDCAESRCAIEFGPGTMVDTVDVDVSQRVLHIRFNPNLGYVAHRPSSVEELYRLVRAAAASAVPGYGVRLWVDDLPVESLIPVYYLDDVQDMDRARLAVPEQRPAPLAQNLDHPWHAMAGLEGRYVALWPSHGWYYERTLDRWEWQRARLFQTIEDLFPMSFTHPYVVPMLERAGATVLLPRERDLQTHEVVVDNDAPGSGYAESGPGWRPGGTGFAIGSPPYGEGVNPFQLGTYRAATTVATATDSVRWTPDIPATGDYAVHIAYTMGADRAADANYVVHHAGGTTRFRVNQQIGGGTWIYLGTFRFEAGQNPAGGSVVLTNASGAPGQTVSADAARFGGGMGSIERGGTTSGRPRWVEAARYYMQYAGMPDSLVYSLSGGENDYTDDFRGRGEWVAYLRGAPFGPSRAPDVPGLGIPVDLSLSFHTDAGVTRRDTTIGTLLIYSTVGSDSSRVFADGVSRLANRDFSDLLQTQIVEDLKRLYDPSWMRRSLWDRPYSEAVRPTVPSALLELLSHQNFQDMKYGMDPRFRFDASRAIYKAILRFLATHHGEEYVIQPLPVSHMEALLAGSDGVTLRWRPTPDPLEASADAEAYIVYTRVGAGGFDNGVLVRSPEVTITGLEPGVVYSYRVAAVNGGGESFPSETLAVAHGPAGAGPVLVVNGFDRVAAPATLETDDLAGFADFWDQGVPDRYDLHYTGSQYNFDREDDWRDDDDPGHGASYGDMETRVIPGNTFDFPYLHGLSLLAAGRGFASASGAAVAERGLDLSRYAALDLILGEQKRTPSPHPIRPPQFEALPEALRTVLEDFCDSGRGLFVSGSYVGTDVFGGAAEDDPGPQFARNTLGIIWRTNHASKAGDVVSPNGVILPDGTSFSFNTGYDPFLYTAEAPDAIEPAGVGGTTALRYAENNKSAAVASRGACPAVVFGFPFETILTQEDRDHVMEAVLRFIAP